MFLLQITIALAALVCVASSTRYLDRARSIWDYGLKIDGPFVFG